MVMHIVAVPVGCDLKVLLPLLLPRPSCTASSALGGSVPVSKLGWKGNRADEEALLILLCGQKIREDRKLCDT